MKKKMGKTLRIRLFGASVLLVLVSLLFLYEKGIKKYSSEETKVVYEYEKVADVDYQVNLKQNSLYNMESVPEETYFITAFTKSIETTFNYQFEGESGTGIEGNYDITALLEGYEELDEVQKTLWKKEFTIMPTKSFKGKDKIEIIEEKITVSLAEYINYVEKFIEESKVDSPVKMTVAMNVNLNAKTPKGDVEEKASPGIEIPLNKNVFEITKKNTGTDTGAIEKTEAIITGPNIPAIIIFSLTSVAFLLLIIYIIVFTTEIEQDPLESYVGKIFKNYGNRLVALNEDIHLPSNNTFIVYSIEDLVKIADEIAMLIFYQYKENHKEIEEFYVFQDQSVFYFSVKEGLKEKLYKPGNMKKKSLVAIEESR